MEDITSGTNAAESRTGLEFSLGSQDLASEKNPVARPSRDSAPSAHTIKRGTSLPEGPSPLDVADV